MLNGTRHHKSIVRYQCEENYKLIGRSELECDIDERWNGPPPRCEREFKKEERSCKNYLFNAFSKKNIFAFLQSKLISRLRIVYLFF